MQVLAIALLSSIAAAASTGTVNINGNEVHFEGDAQGTVNGNSATGSVEGRAEANVDGFGKVVVVGNAQGSGSIDPATQSATGQGTVSGTVTSEKGGSISGTASGSGTVDATGKYTVNGGAEYCSVDAKGVKTCSKVGQGNGSVAGKSSVSGASHVVAGCGSLFLMVAALMM